MKPLLSHILLHGINEHTPIEQIELALEEHPYSATLAVLLTKAYTERNDVRFEGMLSKSALLTQQRKNLHAFVYQMMNEAPGSSTVLEPTKASEAAQNDNTNAVDLTRTTPVLADDSEPFVALPESRQENKAPTENTSNATSDSKEDEALPTRISRDPDELLTQQYLAEALAGGVLGKLLADESNQDGDSSTLEADKASESEPFNLEQNAIGPTKKSDEVESTAEPEKLGLSAWMHFLNDADASAETQKDSKGIEEAEADTEPNLISRPEKTDNSSNTTSPTVDLSGLIDRFVAKEDEIVPKRASFYSPEKAAKASLQDNDTIVTETLARIYAEQGNIPKAISTYEKLRLLHPEKSSYFAALIQKLKRD